MSATGSDTSISVVVATRDRGASLLGPLDRLCSLPEKPEILVVDNGSKDGTPQIVRARYPWVRVLALRENAGAAARNVGVREASGPYVAFSDDDSWWAPGALTRARKLLDDHDQLGLVAARILVGRDRRLDPTCAAMASSPLSDRVGPGRPVLGFVACGAVVRRSAFMEVGGFDPQLVIGGEEQLLAIDLAAAGWDVAYVDDIVAHHHPAPGSRSHRRRLVMRNDLWVAWMRRRVPGAAGITATAVRRATADGDARWALIQAVRGAPTILRRRRPVTRDLDRAIRLTVSGRRHHRRARAG